MGSIKVTEMLRRELREIHSEVDFINNFDVHIKSLDGRNVYQIYLTLDEQRYIMYKLANWSIEDLLNSRFYIKLLRTNYPLEYVIKVVSN
jgi:hypothetical protein